MSEFEAFEQFLDRDVISLPLVGAGLSADEAAIAAGAIQHERAQFVVDAAAEELGRRAVDLRRQRDEHASEASRLNGELGLIVAALKTGLPEEDLIIETPVDWDRLKEITYTPKWSDFMAVIKDEPAFTLWFGRQKGIDKFDDDFAQKHRNQIKSLVGGSAISRALTCLIRAQIFNWPAEQDDNIDGDAAVWGISEVIRDDNNNAIGIKVAELDEFFYRASALPNFGVKSAKAIMIVAYLQRQQYLEAHAGVDSSTQNGYA